jgi:glycosyltransferase involved in cell wall biosynthesis
MSFSQDLATIIRAANLLGAEQKNIVFIMAGDGPEKDKLMLLAKSLRVSNVRFLPFQQGDDYWRLLGASDVCLVSLKASKVKTPVVPRKLHDIMAAGRVLIAHIPPNDDVQKIIEKAHCGLLIEPEDPAKLASAIKKIFELPLNERLQFGINGRVYAIQNFTIERTAGQFEFLFKRLGK